MGSSKDIGSYLILAAIGIVLLVVIYFMARWKPLAGTITFGIGVGIWLFITPPRSSSDPAGAGVEAGLGCIFNIIKSIVLSVVFYYFMKHYAPDTVLLVTMILLVLYFGKRLIYTDF